MRQRGAELDGNGDVLSECEKFIKIRALFTECSSTSVLRAMARGMHVLAQRRPCCTGPSEMETPVDDSCLAFFGAGALVRAIRIFHHHRVRALTTGDDYTVHHLRRATHHDCAMILPSGIVYSPVAAQSARRTVSENAANLITKWG